MIITSLEVSFLMLSVRVSFVICMVRVTPLMLVMCGTILVIIILPILVMPAASDDHLVANVNVPIVMGPMVVLL